MPHPLSDDQTAALSLALQQGRKIEAIKLFRNYTGFGLKESKDAIESLESDLRAQFPDKFPPPAVASSGLGFAALILVAVILVLLVIVVVNLIH
jgi:hypothetical protein